MAPSRLGIVAFSLAGLSPAALHAQDLTSASPARAPLYSQNAGPGQLGQTPDSPLAPNVTITTPDGRPLPPELLKKILGVLKSDPTLRGVLNTTTPETVRTTIDDMTIVVTAKRVRGSVLGDVPPTRTFNPLDIRAYGARDVAELIAGLSAEVTSVDAGGPKQPIVLLNGKRISSFDEIASYPTEAIARLEVFPEDLALRYGFPAGRKVVNIITADPFKSTNVYTSYGTTTEGGRETFGANGRYLHLKGGSRYNINMGLETSRRLLESERDLVVPLGRPTEGRFRTLLPESRQLTINGSSSHDFLGGNPLTLTGKAFTAETEALLGLGAGRPLTQDVNIHAVDIGAALSGRLPGWFWYGGTTYRFSGGETFTDGSTVESRKDEAHASASTFSVDASLSGSLFELPSGRVSATIRSEYSRDTFKSRASHGDRGTSERLLRDRSTVFANLDVPLASRDAGTPTWLGNLSVNAQVGLEQLTRFGALYTAGYGVYWSPISSLRLNISTSNQQTAPLLEQLGAPTITTPNVRTFDYVRGETVDVTRTSGANLDLRSDDRQLMNIGLSFKPARNVSLIASFTRTDIDDPILIFPIITQPVQTAFPERFTRDTSGRLVRVDSTPINLSSTHRSQLRWGLNFTRSLGRLPGGAELIFSPTTDGTIPPGTLPPNSRVIDNPPGTPLPPEIENALSRVFFSVYHTWHVADTVVLREGGATLDLLDGFALDGRNGRPRHELEVSGGLFRRGIGARVNVRWQSTSRLSGVPSGTGPAGADLRFSYDPLADVTVFINPEDRLVGAVPSWLRKLQLVFSIKNALNARPFVRDESGNVPLNYQAPYLDPVGRSINVSLRKLF